MKKLFKMSSQPPQQQMPGYQRQTQQLPPMSAPQGDRRSVTSAGSYNNQQPVQNQQPHSPALSRHSQSSGHSGWTHGSVTGPQTGSIQTLVNQPINQQPIHQNVAVLRPKELLIFCNMCKRGMS
jgi:hypothetical protein